MVAHTLLLLPQATDVLDHVEQLRYKEQRAHLRNGSATGSTRRRRNSEMMFSSKRRLANDDLTAVIGRTHGGRRSTWLRAQMAINSGAIGGSKHHTNLEDRVQAAAEQQREEAFGIATKEEKRTAAVLTALAQSKAVQAARQKFAWRTLLRKMVWFLAFLLLFAFMTPLAGDYDNDTAAQFATSVQDRVDADFGAIRSAQDWWAWFDFNVLWMPPVLSPPGASAAVVAAPIVTWHAVEGVGAPEVMDALVQPVGEVDPWAQSALALSHSHGAVLDENLVLGPLTVTVWQRNWTGCPEFDQIGHGPVKCLGEASLGDSTATVWLLSADNVTARREATVRHRMAGAQPWLGRVTREVTVEVDVYNPHVGLFAAISLAATFSTTGVVTTDTNVLAAFLFRARFQPSAVFQAVTTLLFVAQVVTLVTEVRRMGMRRFFKKGWNIYELVLAAGLAVTVVLDLVTQRASDDLEIDVRDATTPVALRHTLQLIRFETDVLAIVLLMVVLRLVKYLRLIPRWGPMMVAVLMTWQDLFVQLYLAVALGLTACIAVSFHVAFGSESPAFSSLSASFLSLFSMVRPGLVLGFGGEVLQRCAGNTS